MNEVFKLTENISFTLGDALLELIYVIASVLFIIGLKMLSSPKTAKRGNLWAALGMVMAIIATISLHEMDGEPIKNIGWIIGAIALGTVIGWAIAVKVKMTAMPQLVSFFNGMGGASAALISLMEFPHLAHGSALVAMHTGEVLAILLGLMIGSVSFAGSMIAFGKLDGRIKDIRASALRVINLIFLAVLIGFIVYIMTRGEASPAELMPAIYLMLAISLIYGVSFVMPIGGADMPVVISLLNSFTGVAAAMGGFLYDNQAMLTGGILVGSAGTILTILMCRAMNRSLTNVILGAFGGGGAAAGQEGGTVKEISLSDAAVLLNYSQKIYIIPGYGLAVAQAQHLVNEMSKMLERNGVEVKFGIHSVAGRMPGHMNVLLAEADVPYEKLIEERDASEEMSSTDVAVVIGANDVVNPAAEEDPSSPIYGMPIIRAGQAKNIIVMKRGMGKGYAAIENSLFYNDKTRMLFGNAKDSLQKLIEEIKAL
ncbi:NAD(P) transhydrogenase subunit beta [Salinivirga cyanobacteriivorans]|uniref:NAD(P) transhydrogenase subunit beta n=1 Tax=Salinivirga cyanobacteriivorans TaxID=1307839 RepID=A0A0S2I577_9BACT|nr:NAD(P)(+) transhydrogenase (Re/Si-specific) subunit beta [Salinivirga cyanobacteriivorans]ALO17422.1 NAD(P) transhydrogenase subunit beta [Salinivirga cyanobacteriivorans]